MNKAQKVLKIFDMALFEPMTVADLWLHFCSFKWCGIVVQSSQFGGRPWRRPLQTQADME